MRLLFSVQRYGELVAGGSESACRAVSEALAARGHDVHVLTSRALSYVDWADHYDGGAEELNGVTVHRLGVRAPWNAEKFAAINNRILTHPYTTLAVQREWLRMEGPDLPGQTQWLDHHARGFDAAIFFTYLYPTTPFGLPVAAKYCPVILVPTAHDEPWLWLRVFDACVRLADGVICLTPEELDLVRRRFRFEPRAAVIGLGVDSITRGDGDRFREQFGLGDRRYLVVLGRVDPGKGSDELAWYFLRYKELHPSDLALVIVGDPVTRPDAHPDLVVTGYVDEQSKLDALAGADVVVQPSYFESFSIVLCEGWSQERPALVQGRCEVLAGQVARSNGGLVYRSFAEFAENVSRLLADAPLRTALGRSGRDYVRSSFDPELVIDRYEAFITEIASRAPGGRVPLRRRWRSPAASPDRPREHR